MKRRRWVIPAAIVMIAGGSAVYLIPNLKRARADVDPGRLARVERGTMVRSVVATGRIEPIRKVEIKSKANGIIKVLGVEVGRIVSPGDVLAELDKDNLEARLREAKANYQSARALASQSRLLKVVSPEIMRYDLPVKSRYNAGSMDVHGVEPQYQEIRTIELDYGRLFSWQDEEQRHKVAILGADVSEQLFGSRNPLGESVTIGGVPYEVVGQMRKKNRDSNYSGPDNTKIFVPFASMQQDHPAIGLGFQPDDVSAIIVTPKDDVVREVVRNLPVGPEPMFARDGIIELEVRGILARRHRFDPGDKDAVNIWNTTIQTAMFDRIIVGMKDFFSAVGFITLGLGGLGVMNIMLIAVKDRTMEIGVRRAIGARTRDIGRQFFLEGFFLTAVSGGLGTGLALGLCSLVNRLPFPDRFSGMIVTWETMLISLGTLVLLGVVASTFPARRAAALPPIEALRYER